MNPSLSVIVTTSPGRESHLAYCLMMLQRQSLQDFEIIVVDDGSQGAQRVTEKFKSTLDLHYIWRENDFCLSRSRNQGLAVARGKKVVFLDSDILLNASALHAYQNCMESVGELTFLYGYYGYYYELLAPSQWFPDQVVNWSDNRFPFALDQQRLKVNGLIFTEPCRYAWGGNCAGYLSSFKQLGGFNEYFKGWGREDEEMAWRQIAAGYQIGFLLDVWAEHLFHLKQEPFHQQFSQAEKLKKEEHLNALIAQCPPHEGMLYASPGVSGVLCQHIREHYLKKGWELDATPTLI